ncbi:unnamed protein product [Clonostachys rosea]|uniref:Zn(2)-C6 fungal-type domain-containing protein n=1 Tax=Bionectria ochroleuca TaxID=29856 RepID=A0ABY6UQ64_BIOOC|nr:unnamed protein product [Clonostachys rosea]
MPPVRGKAACVACRSRKQKCNEKRPECSRCQVLGIKCTWPTARRRGPAKGYTEALERRLGDTELALVQLLLVSTPETIAGAFKPDTLELAQSILANRQANAESGEGLLEGERAEASLMTHWENTSLKTVDGINEWVKSMRDVGPEETSADISVDLRKSQLLSIEGQGLVQRQTAARQPNKNGDRRPAEVCALQQSGLPASHNSASLGSNTIVYSGEAVGKPPDDGEGPGVRRKIDLPAEFQSQFLW